MNTTHITVADTNQIIGNRTDQEHWTFVVVWTIVRRRELLLKLKCKNANNELNTFILEKYLTFKSLRHVEILKGSKCEMCYVLIIYALNLSSNDL